LEIAGYDIFSNTPTMRAIIPQNPPEQKPPDRRVTKDDYLTLRGELAKALQSKECRDFLDSLISYSQGGMHYDSEEDFLAFSDYIYNSPDGGIFWRQGDGGQVGHVIRIGDGIRLDLNLAIYAATLMHELIHGLQGRGSDDTLDRNIRKLGIVPFDSDGKPLPFPTGKRDGKPFNDWSGYWHRALQNACFPNARN
jgi:hypothetical protein